MPNHGNNIVNTFFSNINHLKNSIPKRFEREQPTKLTNIVPLAFQNRILNHLPAYSPRGHPFPGMSTQNEPGHTAPYFTTNIPKTRLTFWFVYDIIF